MVADTQAREAAGESRKDAIAAVAKSLGVPKRSRLRRGRGGQSEPPGLLRECRTHLDRGRLAVRQRSATHRPRRRLRRAVGRVQPVPADGGQPRADGEWHRRARHPDPGPGRPGGRLAARAGRPQLLVIARDLQNLGLSYDLFTRTTTTNHYAIAQELFLGLLKNGYVFAHKQLGAISPSTGRTLPDRYIEGTCPICGYPSARGDQCDNCGNQLDPIDLIDPVSKINGETPVFAETEQMMLDLPAFGEVLATWLAGQSHWRQNVLKFSVNLLDDLKPRATPATSNGGYQSRSTGGATAGTRASTSGSTPSSATCRRRSSGPTRTGDPDAWRAWWQTDAARQLLLHG